MRSKLAVVGMVLLAAVTMGVAVAKGPFDWGVVRDRQLAGHSWVAFGVGQPLAKSSSHQVTKQQALADPHSLFTLANGLHARVVSTQAAPVIDQISLWPTDSHPRWLIACNEEGASEPGIQRINIATGAAATIVRGTEDCDPTRRTPWGTIVFGEESGSGPDGGAVYELMDPLHTTNVTLDRSTGTFSGGTGASNLTARPALGRMAFEGLAILRTGVTYTQADDDDAGPVDGKPGNAFFKFVPDHPFTGGGPITDLGDSPYAAGRNYGLRISGTSADGFGQGREFGMGRWIALPKVPNVDLQAKVVTAGLTGYYRLEDADLDRAALASGHVRYCAASTGDEEAHLFGEIVCVTDGRIGQANANTATPESEPFVIGGTSRGINMPDNIAYQPGRGNWILHEDAETTFEFPHNNDLWDCLPDRADQDLLSDGCIRVGTLNDLTAEWTGGIFDASGTHFFVSVQHNISGKAAVIEITGWQ
jgi:uncharacterized protein DUF839